MTAENATQKPIAGNGKSGVNYNSEALKSNYRSYSDQETEVKTLDCIEVDQLNFNVRDIPNLVTPFLMPGHSNRSDSCRYSLYRLFVVVS